MNARDRCKHLPDYPIMAINCFACTRDYVIELESDLATERAAREEAESLAVWAVRHQTEFYVDDNIWSFRDSTRKRQYRQFGDETDAGILAALRRAMEGEK